MGKFINLVGMRFGRWQVVEQTTSKWGMAHFLCQCDCGNTRVVIGRNLRNGTSVSCGCWQKEAVTQRCRDRAKHNLCHTRLHRIWQNMKSRCNNPNVPSYKNYGGRGISVCDEWQEFLPFYEWAMANGYRDDLTIDRINNDGNYEPANCRWATRYEQQHNKRKRKNVKYVFYGKPLKQLAYENGISYSAVLRRLYRGIPIEIALKKERK